jgi:hypothetical protein
MKKKPMSMEIARLNRKPRESCVFQRATECGARLVSPLVMTHITHRSAVYRCHLPPTEPRRHGSKNCLHDMRIVCNAELVGDG